MGLFWYYWDVLEMAFSHSLETAHSIILMLIIALGVLSYFFPGLTVMGVQVSPAHMHAWQAAAVVLGGIVAVRLFLAPYWIWQEQQQKIAPIPTELSWNDALGVIDAFSTHPKPCKVKLTATKETMSDRNILRTLIMQVCEIVDDQRDQNIPFASIDSPAPVPEYGLIVRWHRAFDQGPRTYSVFQDIFRKSVRSGDRMPPNSPPNLIWIDVGTGYPWKR